MSRTLIPTLLIVPALSGCLFTDQERAYSNTYQSENESWDYSGGSWDESNPASDWDDDGDNGYTGYVPYNEYGDYGSGSDGSDETWLVTVVGEPITWDKGAAPTVLPDGNMALTEGRLTGDIGYVTGVEASVAAVSGWGQGTLDGDKPVVTYLEAMVTAGTSNAAAMVIVTLDADLGALVGQGPVRFDYTGSRIDGGGDEFLTAVVCSGAEVSLWSFDTLASEVTVEVTPTEGTDTNTVDVAFTVVSPDQSPYGGPKGGTVTGGFRVDLKEVAEGGGSGYWYESTNIDVTSATLTGAVGPVVIDSAAVITPWARIESDGSLWVEFGAYTDTMSAGVTVGFGNAELLKTVNGDLTGAQASGYWSSYNGSDYWNGTGESVFVNVQQREGALSISFSARLVSYVDSNDDSEVQGTLDLPLSF